MNAEHRNSNEEVEPSAEFAASETELSPEQIEIIMRKVQDINIPGTTFTVLNAERQKSSASQSLVEKDEEDLRGVLEKGLLSDSVQREGPGSIRSAKDRPFSPGQNSQDFVWLSILKPPEIIDE